MTDRPTSPAHASRRALLAGAMVLTSGVLVGCELPGRDSDAGAGGQGAGTASDPDASVLAGVREAAAAAEAYALAVVAAHPGLASRLTPLRETHAAHLAVLPPAGETASASPGTPITPGASPSGPTGGVPEVPRRRRPALRRLLEVEQEYVAALDSGARTVSDGAWARVLASAAAGVAMHQEDLSIPTTGGAS